VAFNKLLEQQHQIMSKDHASGIPSMPPTPPNGSNSSTSKLLSNYYVIMELVYSQGITIVIFINHLPLY
jgi:hypothetical protein